MNRNQDFQGLVDGLSLGLKKVDIVHQFHHVFWVGDLNYRLDLAREKIMQLLDIQHWDSLLRGDQLTLQQEEEKTFHNFKEGKITFPPSYRYERGNNDWSKKKLQNVPSYCDRILWRSFPGLSVSQLDYGMASSMMTRFVSVSPFF